jgi:hypothetical protein
MPEHMIESRAEYEAGLTARRTSVLHLYELPAAFDKIDHEIESLGGELPLGLEEELDALELNLESKAEGVAALIREAESEAQAYKVEIERLRSLYRAAENRGNGLREYLRSTMTALNRTKLATPRFKLSVQRNSVPTIRWPGEPETIPAELKRVRVELDGQAAIEAYRLGSLPEGFDVHVGTHLRIR